MPLFIRLALVFFVLTCMPSATPIQITPDINEILNFKFDPLSTSNDTLAYSSENSNHNLMRIIYIDFMGKEKIFDAETVKINENLITCSFNNIEITIDRRKILHMYILEID